MAIYGMVIILQRTVHSTLNEFTYNSWYLRIFCGNIFMIYSLLFLKLMSISCSIPLFVALMCGVENHSVLVYQ